MVDSVKTAESLLSNRFNQVIVDNISDTIYPLSVEQAYEVQDRVVSRLIEKYNGVVCGYKLACTNKPIMTKLNVKEPFSGRLMNHTTYQSGITLDAADFIRRTVEVEFVFTMAEDVPNILPHSYAEHTIKRYISAFRPGIEIVDYRYTDLTQVGGNALIADNAIHGASVLGLIDYNQWRAEDFAKFPVSLTVNNELISQGSGINVLGSPLNAMAWLANHLQSRGKTLKSGDIVTTGAACDVYNASSGDKITADFGKLGSASLAFK